jgi:hypothetical protein
LRGFDVTVYTINWSAFVPVQNGSPSSLNPDEPADADQHWKPFAAPSSATVASAKFNAKALTSMMLVELPVMSHFRKLRRQ